MVCQPVREIKPPSLLREGSEVSRVLKLSEAGAEQEEEGVEEEEGAEEGGEGEEEQVVKGSKDLLLPRT